MTLYEDWSEEQKGYYSYDPAGAEALLDQTGYPRGAAGIRFKTEYMHFDRFPVSWSEFMVSYWRQIGVEIDILPPTQAEHTARRNAGDWAPTSEACGTDADPMIMPPGFRSTVARSGAVMRLMGLGVPVYVQYGRWIGVLPTPDPLTGESEFRGLLQGSLGRSLFGHFAAGRHLLGGPSGHRRRLRRAHRRGHRSGDAELLARHHGDDLSGDLVGLVTADEVRSVLRRPAGECPRRFRVGVGCSAGKGGCSWRPHRGWRSGPACS